MVEECAIFLTEHSGNGTSTHYVPDKTAPEARAGHTAVIMPPTPNSPSSAYKMVVFGGNYQNKYLNSLYMLDILPDGTIQKWHKPDTKGKPPVPRAGHTSTHMPSATLLPSYKMVMFGGFDGKKCFNDVQTFCTETLTWSILEVSGTPPAPRSGHTATLIANRYWLIQGISPPPVTAPSLYHSYITISIPKFC